MIDVSRFRFRIRRKIVTFATSISTSFIEDKKE